MKTSLKNLIMNTKNTYSLLLIALNFIFHSCEDAKPEIQSDCPAIVLANHEEEWPNDYILINSVSVINQELNLNVSHSGGCTDHEYLLIQEPLFCGTPPIFISIHLSHNANNDLCEAWITEDLCFNLNKTYEAFPENEISIVLTNYPHQNDTTWVIEN